jgi:phenylalanyl-tRNA synthetase beta chain
MKVLLSWIRDFVDVPGTAEEIGARMSLRGLALEGVESTDGDAVLDFDVTANRPDCLSIRGIAREIATAYQLPLKTPAASAPPTGAEIGDDLLSVRIADPDLCARYVAAVADVRIGPSPSWMQSRLAACGVRPINNIVDVTNYVLLELGYPMHAFDYARLRGAAIVVRRARPGEKITTLDGKTRTLDDTMLAIADADTAQAIGGVMGGAASEVSATTTRIVFEAAWFKPQSVRATSKRLGLRTEASYRFERGADLTATAEAMARARDLIAAIGAGQGVGTMLDCYPQPAVTRTLTLNAREIQRVLGMNVPDADVERILGSLGFVVRRLGAWQAAAPEAATPMASPGADWQVDVPGWRVDVTRPVDLIEEVGRHYGFEHLPDSFPTVEQAPARSDARITRDAAVRRTLLAIGVNEAITFAFIEAAAAAPFLNGTAPVALANPLSEKFTTMRPSLLPGLLDAVSHNRRHGMRDVRLFEIGTRFSPQGETRAAAVAWTGAALPEHWSGGAREVDFFDLKGAAEHLGSTMNVDIDAAATTRPFLVEGRAAELRAGERTIGIVGQVAPSVAERRDLPASDAIYVLEIDLDALTAATSSEPLLARPLPRHPAVVRDLAILLDETLSAESVRGTIRAAAPDTLIDVREFDRYQGKGVPEGKVSLAVHLTFQAPDRTLTDAEVSAAMQRIVTALSTQLAAVQR